MAPLLSICIPIYSRAQYLALALDSILPQINPYIEIVIIPDDLADKTQTCLDIYKAKCPGMKILEFSQTMGIDKNIENCFLHATGQYVFLFSGDDILMPDSLCQIIECIKNKEPSVICLNHFSFKNHSLAHKFPPVLANKTTYFDSGRKFFKYCGLGFLSSLIVDRYEALKYLSFIKKGKERAHLDIVARVSLTGHGPFIFLGKVHVGARSIDCPHAAPLNSWILYRKAFYEDLLDERFLDLKTFHFFIRRLIYKDLPKILFKLVKAQDALKIADYECPLKKAFGESLSIRLVTAPFFYLNKKFLNILYRILFATFKTYRKIKILFSS